jgi:putative lipoprotein
VGDACLSEGSAQRLHPLRGPRWLAAAVTSLLIAGCGTTPPAPDAVVTGTALTRERMVLPPEAVFEATLLDVSQPGAPPVVLGRQRRDPAGQPPYALRIPYPSVRFNTKGRYEVRAAVTLEGRLLLATDSRHPVPTDAAYRHVDVWMRRQPSLSAVVEASVPLVLTHWRLVAIEEDAVPRPAEGEAAPHLVLQTDEARVTGSGGCNRFIADYNLEGAQLYFSRAVSNITLCLDRAALEGRFFTALESVASYRQEGTQLLLRTAQGQTLLRFEAQETPLQ